jgi:hypothetical protein
MLKNSLCSWLTLAAQGLNSGHAVSDRNVFAHPRPWSTLFWFVKSVHNNNVIYGGHWPPTRESGASVPLRSVTEHMQMGLTIYKNPEHPGLVSDSGGQHFAHYHTSLLGVFLRESTEHFGEHWSSYMMSSSSLCWFLCLCVVEKN